MSEGLYKVLPRLACNPLQDMLGGMTQRGLLNIIFPNGETMFSWFKAFNERSLKKLSILGKFKGASWKEQLNIAAPVGLPSIQGITKRKGKGRGR